MKGFIWVFVVALVSLQADGYILLTANIEDLQAIAKRIVTSPMANQVHNILRRASTVFTHHVNRANDDDGSQSRAERRSDTKHTNGAVTVADDQQSLGKNVSVFLKSIRKIFENI